MNYKLLCVTLLSFVFFHNIFQQKRTIIIKKTLVINPTYLKKSVSRKHLRNLLKGMITGDKRSISKKIIKKIRALNLLHILTPSGLHLASLFFLLFPFLKFIRHNNLRFIIKSILLILPFFLPGLWAIKRVCLLRFALSLKTKIDPFLIFLGVFILDFFFGTYANSPLSFICSFLFIGIIFSLKDQPKILFPIGFLMGNMIISYYFKVPFTNSGFLLGIFCTLIFTIIFPFLLIGFISSYLFFIPGLNLILVLFNDLISILANISIQSGYSYFSIPLLLFCLFLLSDYKKYAFIFLLLHSNPTLNTNQYTFRRKVPLVSLPKKEEAYVIFRTRFGFKAILKNGKACLFYQATTLYKKKCENY